MTDVKTRIGQTERKFSTKHGDLKEPVATKIINTTNYVLKPAEKSILLRGLKFCPVPKNNEFHVLR